MYRYFHHVKNSAKAHCHLPEICIGETLPKQDRQTFKEFKNIMKQYRYVGEIHNSNDILDLISQFDRLRTHERPKLLRVIVKYLRVQLLSQIVEVIERSMILLYYLMTSGYSQYVKKHVQTDFYTATLVFAANQLAAQKDSHKALDVAKRIYKSVQIWALKERQHSDMSKSHIWKAYLTLRDSEHMAQIVAATSIALDTERSNTPVKSPPRVSQETFSGPSGADLLDEDGQYDKALEEFENYSFFRRDAKKAISTPSRYENHSNTTDSLQSSPDIFQLDEELYKIEIEIDSRSQADRIPVAVSEDDTVTSSISSDQICFTPTKPRKKNFKFMSPSINAININSLLAFYSPRRQKACAEKNGEFMAEESDLGDKEERADHVDFSHVADLRAQWKAFDEKRLSSIILE